MCFRAFVGFTGSDADAGVLRIGPYRFYFWSRENAEPPHIHVGRERMEAKFWIDPAVELARNRGFVRQELRRIQGLVEQHRAQLVEAWHDHFNEG